VQPMCRQVPFSTRCHRPHPRSAANVQGSCLSAHAVTDLIRVVQPMCRQVPFSTRCHRPHPRGAANVQGRYLSVRAVTDLIRGVQPMCRQVPFSTRCHRPHPRSAANVQAAAFQHAQSQTSSEECSQCAGSCLSARAVTDLIRGVQPMCRQVPFSTRCHRSEARRPAGMKTRSSNDYTSTSHVPPFGGYPGSACSFTSK
jgi:hypothetical protein